MANAPELVGMVCIGGLADGKTINVEAGTRVVTVPCPMRSAPRSIRDPLDCGVVVAFEAYLLQRFEDGMRQRWFLVWDRMSPDDALRRVAAGWPW